MTLLVVGLVGMVGCAQEAVHTSSLADFPTGTTTHPLAGRNPFSPVVVSTPSLTATTVLATPTSPDVPCQAAALAVSEGGQMAASGMIDLILYFRNQGTEQCVLAGVPGLELLSGDDKAILSTPASTDLTGWKTWDGKHAEAVVLLPGLVEPIPHRDNGLGYAVAYLIYSTRGPGAGRCQPLVPAPSRMRLTLPMSGETLLLDWSIGTCDGRIGVSPFQATSDSNP